MVGGYQLGALIGAGSSGTVYRALSPSGQEVAIKLLHPHVAQDPVARKRLAREARMAQIDAPAVAAVLDVEVEGSEPFIVSQLVEGPTLAQAVADNGPLSPEELANLAEDLATGLNCIHAAGVLHRDVTPRNVVLSSNGPVLIDFGLAQAQLAERFTETGMVMGTAGYVPPELVGESAAGMTVAVDWWAWAAVLAYAALGRPAFGSGNWQAIFMRMMNGQLEVDGAEPHLAAVLRAALDPDPDRRAAPLETLQGLSDLADVAAGRAHWPAPAVAAAASVAPAGPSGGEFGVAEEESADWLEGGEPGASVLPTALLPGVGESDQTSVLAPADRLQTALLAEEADGFQTALLAGAGDSAQTALLADLGAGEPYGDQHSAADDAHTILLAESGYQYDAADEGDRVPTTVLAPLPEGEMTQPVGYAAPHNDYMAGAQQGVGQVWAGEPTQALHPAPGAYWDGGQAQAGAAQLGYAPPPPGELAMLPGPGHMPGPAVPGYPGYGADPALAPWAGEEAGAVPAPPPRPPAATLGSELLLIGAAAFFSLASFTPYWLWAAGAALVLTLLAGVSGAMANTGRSWWRNALRLPFTLAKQLLLLLPLGLAAVTTWFAVRWAFGPTSPLPREVTGLAPQVKLAISTAALFVSATIGWSLPSSIDARNGLRLGAKEMGSGWAALFGLALVAAVAGLIAVLPQG